MDAPSATTGPEFNPKINVDHDRNWTTSDGSGASANNGDRIIFFLIIICALVIFISLVGSILSSVNWTEQLIEIERTLTNAIQVILQQFTMLGSSVLKVFLDLSDLFFTELTSVTSRLFDVFNTVATYIQNQVSTIISTFANNIVKYSGMLSQILLQALTSMGSEFGKIANFLSSFTYGVIIQLQQVAFQALNSVLTFVISMFNTVFSFIFHTLSEISHIVQDIIDFLEPRPLEQALNKQKQKFDNASAKMTPQALMHHFRNMTPVQMIGTIQFFSKEIRAITSHLNQSLDNLSNQKQ